MLQHYTDFKNKYNCNSALDLHDKQIHVMPTILIPNTVVLVIELETIKHSFLIESKVRTFLSVLPYLRPTYIVRLTYKVNFIRFQPFYLIIIPSLNSKIIAVQLVRR